MKIHESAEDYLEMILMLQEKNGSVRSVDIATGLNVTKPSVSVAMKNLRENGYIVMDKDNHITLTDDGLAIASKIYDKHKAITKFLMQLGVDELTARDDACKIEHDISQTTYEAILRNIRY
jgi:DtxR family Mn-dependent transcriptional regulator